MPQSDTIILFEKLNIAVINSGNETPATAMITAMEADADVKRMRPEFYLFASNMLEDRYAAWVREGLHILAEGALGIGQPNPIAVGIRPASENSSTWGIQAVRADQSTYSGRGIKIAVLDTGFDLTHPDFQGRNVTARSFVSGETVHDGNGHGTHCIGTAAGPRDAEGEPRYGVAYEADIYAGKVLGNNGSGRESDIFAGMNWAITEGCEVISMSLGRPTSVGEPFDPIYEDIGLSALDAGCLIIAAAGNESRRQFNFVAPVGSPANAPSIMAVAAVDEKFRVANFSCAGINSGGGEINLSAPGVEILSSYPMPRRHGRSNGTSMACPHVAGVAALLAQSDTNLRGTALWDALRRSAVDISLPIRDGGAGLVQAPISSSPVNA
ncbi:S8 family serine peptidase [uncultured Ruegeria sp.]|uniref:S8 family peptidase n=1 Tax=uncultured Ruegeria sp. TaxID=259304 RepID=UPI0026240170|nr:S8 family serine peptidase [uncultured Ruegeria sp.]